MTVPDVPEFTVPEKQVQDLFKQMLVRNAAQEMYDEQIAISEWTPAEFKSPEQLAAESTVEPEWLVEGLWEKGHTALLFAEAKSGKTTFIHNLYRSLVTGYDFLDMRSTRITGNLVMYDCELTAGDLGRWLNKVGMPSGQAFFASMRGRESHLDFRSRQVRKLLKEELKPFMPISVLGVDPIGAVLQALGAEEKDNTVVGALLRAFNDFLADLEIDNGLISTHTGHNIGVFHPRGASAFKDVPDSLWCYERVAHDQEMRLLNTRGRHDPITDCAIIMDPLTHQLYATDEVIVRKDNMPKVKAPEPGA